MFSATLPKNILNMSETYMDSPKRVSVGEINVVAQNIKQEVIRIEQDKKYEELLGQLHERMGSVIVFVKTKHGADKMAKKLRRDGFTSDALHGDLKQNKRDKVMQNFRKMNFRVLIATDIAARGLDVPHIEHVINYDLPQVAEDFIHRMGRTARAGAEGSAISFVSNQDGRKWHAIEKLLNPDAKEESGYHEEKRSKAKRKPRQKFGQKSGYKKHSDRHVKASDAAKPSHMKSSQAKPDQGKPSQGKANQGKTSQGKTNHGKADQVQSAHAKPARTKAHRAKSSQGKPSHAKSGHAKSSHAKSAQGKPGHVKTGQGKPFAQKKRRQNQRKNKAA
jgi:superfamily II DNA/RNA helicase